LFHDLGCSERVELRRPAALLSKPRPSRTCLAALLIRITPALTPPPPDKNPLRKTAAQADIVAVPRANDRCRTHRRHPMFLSLPQQRRPALPAAAAIAATALGTAAWVDHAARRAERLHPAKGRFIHIDGVRLHYRLVGEGPPVLLLHGNLVHGEDFEASRLLDRLSRNHRVLVIDRPGFGHSDRARDRTWTPAEQARLLYRAAMALGLEGFAVLGHSLGTQVAVCMALAHPDHVKRLVLVSGYYFPSLRLDTPMAHVNAVPWLGDAMRYTVSSLSSRLLLPMTVRTMFAPAQVPDAFFECLPADMLLRPLQQRATTEDGSHMVRQARALRKRYPALQMPVTIIAGSQDKVVNSSRQSRRLHDLLPHSSYHLLDGVGHMAHYHSQALIAKAVAGDQ
jgi:pimeloyl-ACP methyl ester carboxylesterase